MTAVREIMSTELVVVSPQLSLRDLVDLLAQQRLGGAPVVTEGSIVGVITLADILSFQAGLPPVPIETSEAPEPQPEARGTADTEDEAVSAFYVDLWPDAEAELPERAAALLGPEWDVLSQHTVEEAMSRKLWTISPDATIEAAARRMEEAQLHRLLVVERGSVSGIVTSADITRAVAEGLA